VGLIRGHAGLVGLAGFASTAPVPVFAVAGFGTRTAVQDLRLSRAIELVDTPRAATILLIAGSIDPAHGEALARIHDQLPHPRATALWGGAGAPSPFDPEVVRVPWGADPTPALRETFRSLLEGGHASEPSLLPDVDPVEWRGVGPYGQGGSGMTGGTPYGRPMAELAPDRDGLRLDALPLAIGPFYPRLPAGLVVEMTVAGDVLTDVVVPAVPGRGSDEGSRRLVPPSPFERALTEPVRIAELEFARARSHLRWLSDALINQGLIALGIRALRLARESGPGDAPRIRSFARQLGRTGLFRWSLPRGHGVDAAAVAGAGIGPVSRAAGLDEDVRTEDPAYRSLGFRPIVVAGNDVPAWWRVRLAEAADSLDLAARAGEARTKLIGRVESPRGRLEPDDNPTARTLRLVPGLLTGLEWGDAMATLTGLDLDLDESPVAAAPALGATA